MKEVKILGTAKAATFAGVETANGYSKKVFVDDMAVNKEFSAPADLEEVMLVGGVDIEVVMEADYAPQKIGDDRVRTCRIDVSTRAKPIGTTPTIQPAASKISCPGDEEARISAIKINEALAIANAASEKAGQAEAKAEEANLSAKSAGTQEDNSSASAAVKIAEEARKVAEEAKSTADMAIDISSKTADFAVNNRKLISDDIEPRVKSLEDRPISTGITEEERKLLNKLPSLLKSWVSLPWWVHVIIFTTVIVISVAIATALARMG